MKVIVSLIGPIEPVSRQGVKCNKRTTYEWELPDISTGALTRLRIDLDRHHKSGIAGPIVTEPEYVDGERVITIKMTLKKPVMRGTRSMVKTSIMKALRDRKE